MDQLLLIVEDDPSLREVIRLGLEGEGFRVAAAEDGPSALIAFASQSPDLVLLDVMLPGLDGFAVCRELRKVSLVPIVMLTARTSTADVVGGLEAGADDYVTKPFEFPELARPRPFGVAPGVGKELSGGRQTWPDNPPLSDTRPTAVDAQGTAPAPPRR